MIQKPWVLDERTWGRINKLPPAQRSYGLLSYQHHNHNSFKVPCFSAFTIYGLFLLLIMVACGNSLLSWSSPSLHSKCKRKLRWLRAHVFQHALFKRKHAAVASFPYLDWFTLQLPLRGEALVIFLISLLNFLPLVAFYDLYVDTNLIYPGPSSKRDQICRHLADRAAILGTAQLPLLILMASKRTPLAIVSGLGMNSLMLYHRWIARWFWLHILTHASAYTAIYIRRQRYPEVLKETYISWGIVGLCMMSGLVFLSLRSLRQRSYEIFVILHIVMAFFAVLGTYLHIALIGSPKFQIFKVMTEIAAAMWAFDRAVRLGVRIWLSFSATRHAASTLKSGSRLIKCATADICTYGQDAEYSKLRISIPASKLRLDNKHSLLGGIAAGDDIRITIPRFQLGEHPFTVFGVGTHSEDPAQGYIDLLIKTEAGLTRKLARHAGKSSDVELANGQRKGSNLAVMVEGPFGVVPDVHEASDLVLVAGGIAITFCWPIFVSAFKTRATSDLRSCKLIWIVRKEATLELLRSSFAELAEQMQAAGALGGCRMSMDIYVTSDWQQERTRPTSEVSSSKELCNPVPSRSSSSHSTKEKSSREPVQPDGECSSPSDEVVNDVVEVSMVSMTSHRKQSVCREKRETLFDDRANGELVQVSFGAGRPAVLPAALFGHLDDKVLRDSEGLTVCLCGPPSLCDDVRFETVSLMKRGIHVDLVEDCFSW
ncbi:Ferric reductase transmembrane component 3 [Pseudozyma hubeiensis]|nr:Ferric reductase transmembrane component 3 [Pseudozyma hubeiensis]